MTLGRAEMADNRHTSSLNSGSSKDRYLTHKTPAVELASSQDIALQETGAKQDQNDESQPPRKLKGPLWGVLVGGLVCANLLISMDNTIVADIQAAILLDLGDFPNFPWISVGFELGAASANLFW